MIRYVGDARVAAFVSATLGISLVPPFTAMGIERDGEIIVGVVFNVFEGADVHLTIAGRGFTRGFLAEIGHYVFDQLGCERMTGQTEQPKIVRLAERCGGQIEGLKRNHFGKGRDAYLVGILKEEWKW